jgi:hydrogenase maturation factor
LNCVHVKSNAKIADFRDMKMRVSIRSVVEEKVGDYRLVKGFIKDNS